MIEDKIFIIGFNKCGTQSLHDYFESNGYPCRHWDRGQLANTVFRNAEKGIPVMTGYENIKVFSDMEEFLRQKFAYMKYFREMERDYPKAKFIYNNREVEGWIRSRNNHQDNYYINKTCEMLNMTKEEVNDKWRREHKEHYENVVKYFEDKPGKLVIFDIEHDTIDKINDFFPELNLKSEHYKHLHKTKKRN